MDLSLRPTGLEACDASWSFLQSAFWASFKADFGWRPRPFAVSASGGPELSLLVMERALKAGLRFAYCPHGPELEVQGAEERSALLAGLAAELRPSLSSSLFLRFDPPWYEAEALSAAAEEPLEEGSAEGRTEAGAKPAVPAFERPSLAKPLHRASADVQPPDSVLLDLGPGEEELLAAMKHKWRYNVRLAEKKGVLVEEARAGADWRPALERFYALYRETSERDRIALHPERYYRRLFEIASGEADYRPAAKKPDLRIWTATHEGQPLAAIITLFWGGQATYLYGASSNEKRNLMPAYALQWAAIRAARASGCTEYDFYGIPPTEDPDHPMAGLYRFKTGFGGRVIHRAGSWDYPLKPILYGGFRRAESLRTWYYKDFRKRH